MILAGFSGIEKSYPSKKVLKGASGAIKTGERIAFLGANGTGKTTLLEILAGRIGADAGSLDIPKMVTKGYLPQDAGVTGNLTLFEYTLAGFEILLAMKNRLHEIHQLLEENHENQALLSEMGVLQTRFEEMGGYHMESRVREILGGLGFSPEDYYKRTDELSGGMQNRAALARLLAGESRLMILDEPTNHIDISGLEFLESFMQGFKGGVIYVSHDRTFIRNTATTIWEMIDGKIMAYPGGYENYLVEREKRYESLMKNYDSQKEFIARTEDFIRRNIAGQKTKQAQSRRRMLARLERIEKPPTDRDPASLKFGATGRSTRIVVKCENASFSYNRSPLFDDLEFIIERGDRIGLFGPNGSGKTTLLRLILGKLLPSGGRVELGRKISIGYYEQLSGELDPRSTPLSVIRDVKPGWTEPQIRSYLGRFLFRGEDVFREVWTFSGGEQSRLVLSRIIAGNPNFLVLDEPTNHLDIQSREALENALADFDGTVLCVSHDRQFLDSFAERIFVIEDGSLGIYLGNYSDYRERRTKDDSYGKPDRSRQAVHRRKQSGKSVNPQLIGKITDRIDSAEKEIADLEIAISELESSTDWQRIWALMEQRDSLYADLQKLYDELDELTGEKGIKL